MIMIKLNNHTQLTRSGSFKGFISFIQVGLLLNLACYIQQTEGQMVISNNNHQDIDLSNAGSSSALETSGQTPINQLHPNANYNSPDASSFAGDRHLHGDQSPDQQADQRSNKTSQLSSMTTQDKWMLPEQDERGNKTSQLQQQVINNNQNTMASNWTPGGSRIPAQQQRTQTPGSDQQQPSNNNNNNQRINPPPAPMNQGQPKPQQPASPSNGMLPAFIQAQLEHQRTLSQFQSRLQQQQSQSQPAPANANQQSTPMLRQADQSGYATTTARSQTQAQVLAQQQPAQQQQQQQQTKSTTSNEAPTTNNQQHQLHHYQQLYQGHNPFIEILKTHSYMDDNIVTLNLSHSHIYEIASDAFVGQRLEHIDLSNNKLGLIHGRAFQIGPSHSGLEALKADRSNNKTMVGAGSASGSRRAPPVNKRVTIDLSHNPAILALPGAFDYIDVPYCLLNFTNSTIELKFGAFKKYFKEHPGHMIDIDVVDCCEQEWLLGYRDNFVHRTHCEHDPSLFLTKVPQQTIIDSCSSYVARARQSMKIQGPSIIHHHSLPGNANQHCDCHYLTYLILGGTAAILTSLSIFIIFYMFSLKAAFVYQMQNKT